MEQAKQAKIVIQVKSGAQHESKVTELSAITWRQGHHVIVLGDYQPLAKDFTPSLRTPVKENRPG